MLQQLHRSTPGRLTVLFGCVLLVSGCAGGGGYQQEMASVAGKVSLDGKPVPGGRVIFLHVEGPAAEAAIQPDGTYKATGVAVGKNAVSIDYRDKPEPIPGGREGMMGPGKSLVPDKYADGKTSGLTLDVKSGANDYNIQMTSEGEAPGVGTEAPGRGPDRAPR